MIRRIAAILVLALTASAQAAPITARVAGCAMPHSRPARTCPRCDLGSIPNPSAALSAASCCKFGASEPTNRAPGIVPAPSRAADDSGSLLALSSTPTSWTAALPVRSGPASAPLRSTDSPASLHSSLRL